MPLILPGVVAGGLLAFITAFDAVVGVILRGAPGDKTLPRQMFTFLREEISPTIRAAATVLLSVSVLLVIALWWLRRRLDRLRGVTPV